MNWWQSSSPVYLLGSNCLKRVGVRSLYWTIYWSGYLLCFDSIDSCDKIASFFIIQWDEVRRGHLYWQETIGTSTIWQSVLIATTPQETSSSATLNSAQHTDIWSEFFFACGIDRNKMKSNKWVSKWEIGMYVWLMLEMIQCNFVFTITAVVKQVIHCKNLYSWMNGIADTAAAGTKTTNRITTK